MESISPLLELQTFVDTLMKKTAEAMRCGLQGEVIKSGKSSASLSLFISVFIHSFVWLSQVLGAALKILDLHCGM